MNSGQANGFSGVLAAMNPDAAQIHSSRLCSHVMHCADDNLVYRDILSRLKQGNSVKSVTENVEISLRYLSSLGTNESSSVYSAGPRIGSAVSANQVTQLVDLIGKGFFIDLGTCRDGDPSSFGRYNGAPVSGVRTSSAPPSLHFDRSPLSALIQSIVASRQQELSSLVIVTACKLERSPDNVLLCDNSGNWFSYDADLEVVQLGSIPGAPRHIVSAALIGTSSPERSTELAFATREDLRELTAALEVTLMPPALSIDQLPWRSIYQIGIGLQHWWKIRAQLRPGEDSMQFVDGTQAFVGLAYDRFAFREGPIFDPLGLVAQLMSLCTTTEQVQAPSTWSKLTALEWARFMLSSGTETNSEEFKLWRLIIACEHIVEVCGDTDRVAKIASHSRHLDELVGISCDSETKIPQVILSAPGEGVRLAESCAEGFEINIRGKLFNPEAIGPTTPNDFDIRS